MKKIKNPNYRRFLDTGEIQTIGQTLLKKVLDNIKGKDPRQARSLIIALYLTGCRPVEALQLSGKDFTRENSYYIIQLKASKKGLARKVYISQSNPFIKELWQYSQSLYPEMRMFHSFYSVYLRRRKTKKGYIMAEETTNKLRYHFMKWFSPHIEGGISPYFLRHNRFSKLAEAGASMQDIRMIKGAKSMESVTPYLHLSTKTAKKIAAKIK